MEQHFGPIHYQNRPNPFTDGTVIRYYLPKTVRTATMLFHDNAGHTIEEIALFDRGHAFVTVQADKLASGIYTYGLTVDGIIVEFKRMVKDN